MRTGQLQVGFAVSGLYPVVALRNVPFDDLAIATLGWLLAAPSGPALAGKLEPSAGWPA